MKCPNCSAESDGKFCQNCGMRLVFDDDFEPINIKGSQDERQGGAVYGDMYSGVYAQPAAQPAEAAESGKAADGAHKGNKTAIIITAIIAGAMAVIAAMFCIVVCTLVNAAPELIEKVYDSSSSEEIIGGSDDVITDYDGTLYDFEDYSVDSSSQLLYRDSNAYDGVKIMGTSDDFYTKYESSISDSGEVTVEVPSQIDGKDVVEIESLSLYIDGAESVKLILPDTVKIIRAYALSFTDNLTEVQLGSGLVSIGDSAFVGDTSLNEITVPSSVTSLDACGLGIYYDEYGNERKSSSFVVCGEKGSAAETYAKQYSFTFKESN